MRRSCEFSIDLASRISACPEGTVEKIMQEVVAATKTMPHRQGRPPSKWVAVLSSIQWAQNTAVRQRLGRSPFRIMRGRELRTAFPVLVKNDIEDMEFRLLDEARLEERMRDVIAVHGGELQQMLFDIRGRRREQARVQRSRGELPQFVRDHVLVTRVRKEDRNAKFRATWTGP